MIKQKIRIILPTFNEKENLEKLIPELLKVFENNDLDADILIVDDNSPDGTGIYAEQLKKKNRLVDVIHRDKKLGIGSAYIVGFKRSINDGIDLIFEMDADLSHDPRYIRDFIDKINDGFDIVIGERKEIFGWGFYRKAISRIGNCIGRAIAGIKIKDLTSGYRVYKKEVIESIGIDSIKSDGYEFQLEMLYRAIKKGFTIASIPITFYDRRNGKSKLSKKDMINFLILSLKIRMGLIDV